MRNSCRALTNDEVLSVLSKLKEGRDKVLFQLGLKTGYRISEMLSLAIADVLKHGKVVDRLTVSSSSMKGKARSRTVPINGNTQSMLREYTSTLEGPMLFPSEKGGAISRIHAWRILTKAFDEAGLNGKLATHSLRKSYATNIYIASGYNLKNTQLALGHKSIETTVLYLEDNNQEVEQLILAL